ncbi:hypothetical protein K435DRAFT_868727 [Dendrothele bispora CBS 962.96]|uniref:Zn(2)-C6 fungal-type domain-containing protein n=1 Tax=Dendrothele bispora (strain CBS 962.96) TaxID=1314807 RepID=A0A4V4HD65_DENBC|nr:hypothetical protein K435DRAFT_868727 [Dendrothele bispora CBS 962.96]
MSPERTSASELAAKPKKKPPACDYCKARRVLCHPQPDGRSCPRCLEKGVNCTTTPVVRRKRRPQHVVDEEKDTEMDFLSNRDAHQMDLDPNPIPIRNQTPSRPGPATETAGSIHSDDTVSISSPQLLTSSSTSPSNTGSLVALPRVQTYSLHEGPPSANSAGPSPSVPRIQLPTHLVQNLFNAFMNTPFSYHPMIPYDRLRVKLAGCGWQPSLLSAEERVLVHCIQAITALTSIDPIIVGPEPLPPECHHIMTASNPVRTVKVDLRTVGRRREGIFQQLRMEALRQARAEGIAINVSPENASSCYLLAALENHFDDLNVYEAAFAWQVRAMADAWCRRPLSSHVHFGTPDLSVRWRSFMMSDAIISLFQDRPFSYTIHDERLLCGPDGLPLEKLSSLLRKGCDTGQFYTYFPSIVFQITRIARKTYENFSGAYPSRHPINYEALKRHWNQILLLQEVCESFRAHAIHLSIGLQSKRSNFGLSSCSSAVSLGWTNIVLCMFKFLKTRLEEAAMTNLYAKMDAMNDDSEDERDDSGATASSSSQPSDSRNTALESIFGEVKHTTCKAAVAFSKATEDVPLLTRLTHAKLVKGSLNKWVHFLMDATDSKWMPAAEGIEALERLRDDLKLIGFSWADYSDLVEGIDSHICHLMADSLPQATAASSNPSVAAMSAYDSLFTDLGSLSWNPTYGIDLHSMNPSHFQHPAGF